MEQSGIYSTHGASGNIGGDSTTYAVTNGITFTRTDGSTLDTSDIRSDLAGANDVLAAVGVEDHNALAILASTIVATEIQAYTANAIGDLYSNGKGKIGYTTHKVLHGLTGCATGEMLGGDCGGGALGSVVGEIAAESYYNANIDASRANDQSSEAFDAQVRDVASLITNSVSIVSGNDGTIADITSSIAVEHNYLNHTQQKVYAQKLRQAWVNCHGDLECYEVAKDALGQEFKTVSDLMNAELSIAYANCTQRHDCAEYEKLLGEANKQYLAPSAGSDAANLLAFNQLTGRTLDEEIYTNLNDLEIGKWGQDLNIDALFMSADDRNQGRLENVSLLLDVLPVIGTGKAFAEADTAGDYALEIALLLSGTKSAEAVVGVIAKVVKNGVDSLTQAELDTLYQAYDDEVHELYMNHYDAMLDSVVKNDPKAISKTDDGKVKYDSDNDGKADIDCVYAASFWDWLIPVAYACPKGMEPDTSKQTAQDLNNSLATADPDASGYRRARDPSLALEEARSGLEAAGVNTGNMSNQDLLNLMWDPATKKYNSTELVQAMKLQDESGVKVTDRATGSNADIVTDHGEVDLKGNSNPYGYNEDQFINSIDKQAKKYPDTTIGIDVSNIPPSERQGLFDRVSELRDQGIDIIVFGE